MVAAMTDPGEIGLALHRSGCVAAHGDAAPTARRSWWAARTDPRRADRAGTGSSSSGIRRCCATAPARSGARDGSASGRSAGAVGTYAHTGRGSSAPSASALGLEPPRSRRRSSSATATPSTSRPSPHGATVEDRHRGRGLQAHPRARVEEPSARGRRLVRMPHKRNPWVARTSRASRACCAATSWRRSRRGAWVHRARHQPLVRRTHLLPIRRRSCTTCCTAWRGYWTASSSIPRRCSRT